MHVPLNMSALVSAIILTIVIMAGKETKATETCQYDYKCSSLGICTYSTRSCDDKCCDDKTKGYNSICCTSSSSDTGAIAGGIIGGVLGAIVFFVFCYWFCCRTPTRVVTTTVTTIY